MPKGAWTRKEFYDSEKDTIKNKIKKKVKAGHLAEMGEYYDEKKKKYDFPASGGAKVNAESG